ncbi:bifunctional UDP-sugar hydrolase/5'-nucleotidase [Geminicoccaceae bacterium 1502E]|nr:bifunctional UDP-sugar hydrolase/5'-nucleotidase [Geminicoccaceae bacterium 1502E]
MRAGGIVRVPAQIGETLDMRIGRQILASAALGLLVAAFVGPAAAEPVRLTILQVNDWDRMEEQQGRGGFARFMTILEEEDAASQEVLLVHSGDMLSPSLLSGFDKGAHMIELMNRVPLDVMVVGNHEFDFGPEVARQRIAEARFPVLGTNIASGSGEPMPGTERSLMLEVSGFRLGFFGITTPATLTASSPGGYSFAPVLETARAMAQELRGQGADLVLAVTHTGREEDFAMFDEGVADIILTGHDHDLRLLYNGRTAMMESGSQAEYVGAMDLVLERTEKDGKSRVTWRPSFRTLDSAAYAPHPEGVKLVAAYEERLSGELDKVAGTTLTPLDSRRAAVRSEETAIGNLIADAMRTAVGADVAITNGGGIRGDRLYEAGTVLTRRDVQSELPFGNKTVKLEVSGADIVTALENGLSRVEDGAGRFPQVSGMTVTAELDRPAGSRVTSVRIGGVNLDPSATYSLATNDFMARGGDGYEVFAAARNLIDPQAARLMASQVAEWLGSAGEVSPRVEGRLELRR